MIAEAQKVWPTWHLLYRAAFGHDVAARLPRVTAATCVLRIAKDPLACYAEEAVNLLPTGRLCAVARGPCRRIGTAARLTTAHRMWRTV